ncbi:MAG: hypothetical protein KJZ54_12130 [Phycisphaerales bacterium]|nr:hypothetical protein [Phycisphaerales bacterium]
MIWLRVALDDDTYRFLKARAERGGCGSVEQYVRRLLDEAKHSTGHEAPAECQRALPRWEGSAIGDLRREDIYGDAA